MKLLWIRRSEEEDQEKQTLRILRYECREKIGPDKIETGDPPALMFLRRCDLVLIAMGERHPPLQLKVIIRGQKSFRKENAFVPG